MGQEVGDGYHAVNPFILVDGAAELLAFCTAVFDGEETERITGPEGRIADAEVRIDEFDRHGERRQRGLPGTTVRGLRLRP